MTKYVFRRSIHGLLSVAVVVAIVMVLIYGLMNKELIFADDPTYSKLGNNKKTAYMYARWEDYGYLHYVPYADYLNELKKNGSIDEETRSKAVLLGKTKDVDSELTTEYIEKFTKYYADKGYGHQFLKLIFSINREIRISGLQPKRNVVRHEQKSRNISWWQNSLQ